MIFTLLPSVGLCRDLFSQGQASPQSAALMSAMDSINRKMGKESIKLASEGFKRPWTMRQENKSPSYTSDWREIMRAK